DLTKDPLEKAMRRMRLADLLVDLRRAPQARAELDLSLAQSGTDSWLEGETLDRMERLYRRSGDMAGLAKKLADLAMLHPQRVAITRRQMRVLTELHRPADASALAAALLQRTPGRRDVREEYVTLLEAQGNIREAITHMEELLRQQPDDGELMLRLAALHARNSAPDRTSELIALFLKQSPDDEGALMKAGRLLERLGLDDSARVLYEKWMQDHPLDPFAGMALASLTHRKGDTKGAIALWRRIAATGDITVASQVASTMTNRGETLAAFEVLKEREKEVLDNPRLLTQLCHLAVQANQEAACLRWLRRYAQLTKDPGELQRLAELTTAVLNRKSARIQLLDSFAKTPAAGTGESILLALAHELTTPENSYDEAQTGRRQADELLTQAWAALPHPAGEPFSTDESLVETARVQVLTRRRDSPGVLRILSESVKRPGGKTSTRLEALTEASAAAFNHEEALRWVGEWKAVAQGSDLPWRTQAMLLRNIGKTEEMLAVLRQAVQQFEDREELTFDLANALSNAGQAPEALAVYRRLFDQKDETTHRLRIGAQMVRTAKKSGQLDLLHEEWKQRQREYPDSPEPWQLLAMLYREKPDVESQCRALAEALRLTPKDIGLIRELAASEDARGNIEKAAELYRQASRSDTSAQAKRSYAEFLLQRGMHEEAVVIMQEIAEAQATTTKEIEELADALMELRLWNEASTLLQRPAQMQAQNLRLQYQKGVALEESGQFDEAARHFIRVLQSNEELVDAVPLPALQRAPLVPESPGAMWWYRLREHGDLAYQYRQWPTNSTSSLPANRAGTTFHVLLPQSLEEAQVFALRHLARLGEIGRAHVPPRPAITLPEDIPMAALWTHVIVGQRDGHLYLHATTEQVRAYPVLLAEWLRGWLEIVDLPTDGAPALWTLAEQQFAGTQPNIAAEAALFHAFACPADQRTAHLERALNFAKRTKDGKERLALLAASLVNEMSVSMMPGLNPRAPLS
ncbi:MAG: tetratricopeptide repeat protein, partial [Roseimicrobium sp.]